MNGKISRAIRRYARALGIRERILKRAHVQRLDHRDRGRSRRIMARQATEMLALQRQVATAAPSDLAQLQQRAHAR